MHSGRRSCPTSPPTTARGSSTRTGEASGTPVVLSHGWPLNADAWEAAARFLADHGHRVIAHDRRGHGRSSQTWNGNEMDTYADDLAGLIEHLDLTELTLVGHSTGGGEIVRYVGRHGTDRVARLVLVSAVPPLMLALRRQPRRTADRGVRRDPRGRGIRPLAALPRPRRRPVLRQQPQQRRLAGRARRLLAAGHGVRAIAPPTRASRRSRPPTSGPTSRRSTCPRS